MRSATRAPGRRRDPAPQRPAPLAPAAATGYSGARMQALVDFLVAHGHLVVFLWVLAGQAGVPVPQLPLLLAAGALAAAGHLSLWLLLALAVVASLLSDFAWYLLGRRYGTRVLALLCRISLEPDSCVRRTQLAFSSAGALTLVTSKFIPGLATAAPPLAGASHMRPWPFLWIDAVGAAIWALAFLLPGYLLGDRIEDLAAGIAITGTWLFGAFAAIVAGWIAFRWLHRRAFLRRLATARITPAELIALQQAVPAPFIVDLRHASDYEADPHVLPGALWLDTAQLEARHAEIPRDRDVVLYCT
jgi:membrane protein DedA with SNARE-associated domain